LSAAEATSIPESIGKYAEVPIDQLICDEDDRDQSELKGADIKALAENIKVRGLIHPVTATPDGSGKLRVISGKRRIAAIKLLKQKVVPTFIRPSGDSLDVISANLFFKEPPPTLRARILKSLLDEKVYKNQSDLGRAMGVHQTTICHMLQVLDLPEEVQKALDTGKLTTHAAKQAGKTGKTDPDEIRADLRGKKFYKLPTSFLIPKEGGDPVPMQISVGLHSVRVVTVIPLGAIKDGFAKALAREVHRVGEKDLVEGVRGFHKLQFHGGKE